MGGGGVKKLCNDGRQFSIAENKIVKALNVNGSVTDR